jgi:hypothetical protein
MMAIINEQSRPLRPDNQQCHGRNIPDDLWGMIQQCWSHNSDDRPSTSIIVELLGLLTYATIGAL